MRLLHYINEFKEETFDLNRLEAAELIKKKCSKYLKETKGNWFIRGIGNVNLFSNEVGYREIRKNRKPQGTKQEHFEWFNKWLQSNGHIRRDQSVSMTSDRKHILISNPLICFVEGNYDYTWAMTSDINDNYLGKTKWYNNIIDDMYHLSKGMYGEITGPRFIQNKLYRLLSSKKITMSEFDERLSSKTIKWLEEYFPKFFFTNKGMQRAYKNKYEIWFKAKGYYYMKPLSENHYYLRKDYKK